MLSAQEFITQRNGKAVDVDGYYGAQCWDLFAYFCKLAGYPIINCTSSGYVKDIWNNRKTNGALKNFNETQIMQKGDWCIWGNCAAAPSSHIAMFVEDIDGKHGKFLGQNQGSSTANIITFPYAGSLGALRPKCYVKAAKPTTTSSKAKYKVGTKVCTNVLATSSTGGKVYKGDWSGTITKVIPGAAYPYLLNNGTGWTNDKGIDSDLHVPK